MKPKLLDLFCGAGGASMGYYRAGFDVEGVDNKPQPNYPFKFYQADALEFPLEGYDAYHASPPCQFASQANEVWRQRGYEYPNHIPAIRKKLIATNKPFVIENVKGNVLRNPTAISGVQFGLKVIRRRYFETSFEMPLVLMVKPSGLVKNGDYYTPFGHGSLVRPNENPHKWGEAMAIDWMSKEGLSQAIPPAYTEYIGKYLKEALR